MTVECTQRLTTRVCEERVFCVRVYNRTELAVSNVFERFFLANLGVFLFCSQIAHTHVTHETLETHVREVRRPRVAPLWREGRHAVHADSVSVVATPKTLNARVSRHTH